MSEAPKPLELDRFGIAPRAEAEPPEGSCMCNGFKPVADFWQEQASAENGVLRAAVAKLVETDDALASARKELATVNGQLGDATKSLGEAQVDLDSARQLLEDLEAELEKTREGLYHREKQAAETRWNFATKHQKLEAFQDQLKFQGEMRRQLIQRVQHQRTQLVAEVEAERQAQLTAAEERLQDVQALKAAHAAQLTQAQGQIESLQAAATARLAEAQSGFGQQVDGLLTLLREDLEDARADALLGGATLTGGAHPAVERMKARAAAAGTAIVPSAAAAQQKAAADAISSAQADPEGVTAAVVAAFEKIDKDGSGTISRIEVVQACKRHDDLRCMLGLPEHIRQEDGSHTALEALFERMAANEEGQKQIALAEFLRVFGPPSEPAATLNKKPVLRVTDATATAAALPSASALPPPGGARRQLTSSESIALFGERLGQLGSPPPLKAADSMEGQGGEAGGEAPQE